VQRHAGLVAHAAAGLRRPYCRLDYHARQTAGLGSGPPAAGPGRCMSRKFLLLLGLLAFVIGLLAYLPARVAINWLPTNLGVRLIGVQGTLFDGHAERVIGADFSISDLHWRLHPGAVLLGRLSADLRVASDLDAITATATRAIWGTTT